MCFATSHGLGTRLMGDLNNYCPKNIMENILLLPSHSQTIFPLHIGKYSLGMRLTPQNGDETNYKTPQNFDQTQAKDKSFETSAEVWELAVEAVWVYETTYKVVGGFSTWIALDTLHHLPCWQKMLPRYSLFLFCRQKNGIVTWLNSNAQ